MAIHVVSVNFSILAYLVWLSLARNSDIPYLMCDSFLQLIDFKGRRFQIKLDLPEIAVENKGLKKSHT